MQDGSYLSRVAKINIDPLGKDTTIIYRIPPGKTPDQKEILGTLTFPTCVVGGFNNAQVNGPKSRTARTMFTLLDTPNSKLARTKHVLYPTPPPIF
jgi:hypothetical protein